MKNIRSIIACLMAAILLTTSSAMAAVTNGGFEDGLPIDSTWNVRGSVTATEYPLGYYAYFDEQGMGGVSQIWQYVPLPANLTDIYLTFRYRFTAPRNTAIPQLVGAFSRKTHGASGTIIDFDILAGETECRSATIPETTTDLTIIAKFDRRLIILGAATDAVISDVGVVDTVTVDHDAVEISIIDVPHAARVNLSFPGISDEDFPTLANTADAKICVVMETGDYDGDGQTTLADKPATTIYSTTITFDNARADINLDGAINLSDRDDVTSLAPLPPMGCPGGRPLRDSNPPDSFLAFLLADNDTGDLPAGLTITDTRFNNAFLYEDSNGFHTHDPLVNVSAQPGVDGMYAVSLKLSSITDPNTRVVFALVGADNQISSFVSLDDVSLDCPDTTMCRNQTNGLCIPLDDGDACTTAETCNSDGTIVMVASDDVPPVITCPADTIAVDVNRRDPSYTGYATATDDCSEPTIVDPPQDFYHVDCPSVTHRLWEATDGTFTSSCMQVISDVDLNTPFYTCIEKSVRECYRAPKTCKSEPFLTRAGSACLDTDTSLPSNVIGCTCTAAEVITECVRQFVRGDIDNSGIIACVDHYNDFLLIDGVICSTQKNEVNDCILESIGGPAGILANLTAPYNANYCDGGPMGTDTCASDTDCASDFNASTNECCIKDNLSNPAVGWCEYRTTTCP